jgi:hypothetical protein
VVCGLSPRLRGGQQDREVGLDLALADVLIEAARPQRALDDDIRVVQICREDIGPVVVHHWPRG